MGNQDYFTKKTVFSGINLKYNIYPRFLNTPFLIFGYGVNYQADDWFDTDPRWNNNLFQYIHLGAGYSWALPEIPLHVNFSVNSHIFLNDDFDGLTHGKFNDRIWTFSLGLEYQFNFRKP